MLASTNRRRFLQTSHESARCDAAQQATRFLGIRLPVLGQLRHVLLEERAKLFLRLPVLLRIGVQGRQLF